MSEFARQILKSETVIADDGSHLALANGVSERQGEFLQSLVRRIRPTVSLEVGLAFGISALFICDELKRVGAKRHIVIDPHQSSEWMNVGIANLCRAGFEKLVELHENPSHIVLPQLESAKVRIDFAFIDGMHTFDQALIDFFYVDQILREGGVVAFDDANWPSIRKLIRFILTNRSYRHFASLPKRLPLRKLVRRYGFPRNLAEAFTDRRIGLNIPHSRCVALQKISRDDRSTCFHRPF